MKNQRINQGAFKGIRRTQQTIPTSTAPQKLAKSASRNRKNNKPVDIPKVIEPDNTNNESKPIEIVQSVPANEMPLDQKTLSVCEAEPIIDSNPIEGDEFPQSGIIHCKTIKSPFSTFIEIDNFLHAPLFAEVTQHTFEFLDPSDPQRLSVDTKFISTSTYYPESPSCQLVSSTIHEVINLSNTPSMHEAKKQQRSRSTVIPLHPAPTTENPNLASSPHHFIKIRVPVVVGEYRIELCIEEEVLFEEEVISIKKIAKNIALANCHFIPVQLSKPLGDGTCTASKGMLAIEGVIAQSIEYTTVPRTNSRFHKKAEMTMLHEIITVELVVQLLQTQSIHVNYPT